MGELIVLLKSDIVDSLIDPLVPIHAILSIEVNTVQLHREHLVMRVAQHLPRKKINIVGICLKSSFKRNQSQP